MFHLLPFRQAPRVSQSAAVKGDKRRRRRLRLRNCSVNAALRIPSRAHWTPCRMRAQMLSNQTRQTRNCRPTRMILMPPIQNRFVLISESTKDYYRPPTYDRSLCFHRCLSVQHCPRGVPHLHPILPLVPRPFWWVPSDWYQVSSQGGYPSPRWEGTPVSGRGVDHCLVIDRIHRHEGS